MSETDGPICIGDDDSAEEANEGEREAGSNGVDSEAGDLVVFVFASRLQTGQKVLHDVNQVSTQAAWNSVKSNVKITRADGLA